MDFNDLKTRLDRMRYSVGQTADLDVQVHARTTKRIRRERGKNMIQYFTDFGAKSPTDAHTILLQAVSAVAGLKDHLKKKVQISGHDPSEVEECMNNSIALSLALDIWNMDKHGVPLKWPPGGDFTLNYAM